MGDPADYRRSESSAGGGSTERVPRWLKRVIIILAIGALLFLAVRLMGGGHEIPSHSGDGTSTEIAAPRSTVGRAHA